MHAPSYRKCLALTLLVCATLAVALAGQGTDVGKHDKVFAAALVEGGGYFVTGGFDKNVRLWKIDDAKKTATEVLPPFDAPEAVLAVAAQSNYVAAGGRGGKLTVWRRGHSVVKQSKQFKAAAVDVKGEQVAFAADQSVFVWDQSAEPKAVGGMLKGVEALAWGKGDELYFARSGRLDALDVKTTTTTKLFDGLPKGTPSAVVGEKSAGFLILDETGAIRRTGEPGKSEVATIGDKKLAASANGVRFVTADGKTLTAWDAGVKDKVKSNDKAENAIQAVAVSPDGTVAAFVDGGGKAHFWNVNENQLSPAKKGDVSAPDKTTRLAVYVSKDASVRRIAAVTVDDNKAKLFLRSNDGTGTTDPADKIDVAVSQLAFSGDGGTVYVVGATNPNKLRRIVVADGKEGDSITLSSDVTALAVVSASAELLVAGTAGKVFVLNASDGKELAKTDGTPVALAAGVDGKGRVRVAWAEGAGNTRRLRLFQYADKTLTELQSSGAEAKDGTPLGVSFAGDKDAAGPAKVGYVEQGKLKLWAAQVREAYASRKPLALDPAGKSLVWTSEKKVTRYENFTDEAVSGELAELEDDEAITAGLIVRGRLVTASRVGTAEKGRLRSWELSDSVAPTSTKFEEIDKPVVALAPAPEGYVVQFENGTLQRFADDGTPKGAAVSITAAMPRFVAGLKGGRFLVDAGEDLQTLEAAAGRVGDPIDTDRGPIYAVAWRPGKDEFVTAGGDGKVRGWKIAGSKVINAWGNDALTVSEKSPVYAVVFLDADTFATGGKDGKVRIYKTTDADTNFVLPGNPLATAEHGGVVFSLAARAAADMTKGLIASASSVGTVKVWTSAGEAVMGAEFKHADVAAAAFNVKGNRLTSIDFRGKARANGVDADGKLTAEGNAELKAKPPYYLVGGEGKVIFVPSGDKVFRLEVP